ncbi:MAG TPA: DUF58 domain-containing protein [Anaerolineaceae bacterium]|nr:DUF58 domain-containing protein [Anaerolineaceae bacterium]
MGAYFITFLAVMILLGALSQDSFIFTLVYLFAGAYLLGNWWNNRVLRSISFTRTFTDHSFLGETIPVLLELKNNSRLPAVWLQVIELVPLEIAASKSIQKIVSFPGHGKVTLDYKLSPKKRGYYKVGPVWYSSGDLLGLVHIKEMEGAPNFLTVYPKVFPIRTARIPSRSPLGDLKHERPIFEDPSRPIGKRDYRSGDSIRRIDWKASASVGKLQVKLFEPSIALETILLLNLNPEEYQLKTRFFAMEMGISIAASLANWIAGKKQAVGLFTNGKDVIEKDSFFQPLQPRKGRMHLMRIMETLARVQLTGEEPLLSMLHRHRFSLSWGTTVIIITGQINATIFDELYNSKRNGLDIVLILCGEIVGLADIRHRAEYYKIPLFYFFDERDLDVWRN